MSSRILVKNLPKHLTEKRFREHFAKKGVVTDAKIIYTKDGRSRLFGFIGYRTAEEANRAVKYFNNSFIDTSRVTVEMAKNFGDNTIARPWSKYSRGSSKYAKLHPEEIAAAQREMQRRQERLKNGGAASKSAAFPGKRDNDANDSSDEDDKTTEKEELERFLAAMNIKKDDDKKKNASNDNNNDNEKEPAPKKRKVDVEFDDDGDDDDDDDEDMNEEEGDGKKKEKVEFDDDDDSDDSDDDDINDIVVSHNVTTKVESKKPGGKGVYLNRTHVTFENSDDEDDDDDDDDNNESHKEGEIVGISIKKSSNDENESDEDDEEEMNDDDENNNSDDDEEEGIDNSDKGDLSLEINRKEEEARWEEGRLFVRNLSYTVTEKDLEKLFRKYGQMSEIHIPIDRDTRRSKGFAYVLFMNPADAVRAFSALDGTVFQGRLLHILPAKVDKKKQRLANEAAAAAAAAAESASYKQKAEERQRALAQNPFNWNSLFLSQNTVATAMADKLEIEKGELLEHDSSNLGVRMALSEAQVVSETKKYLEEEGGVDVALLEKGPAVARCGDVIMVKNIPPQCKVEELLKLFEAFGKVLTIVMPPSKALAIVAMDNKADAERAFRGLAYRRVRHVPIYLEWAPENLFKVDPRTRPLPVSTSSSSSSAEAKPTDKKAKKDDKKTKKDEEKQKKKEQKKEQKSIVEKMVEKKKEEQKKSSSSADLPSVFDEVPKEDEEEHKEGEGEGEGEEYHQDTYSVYCKNLNFDTVEETLRKAFEDVCGRSSVIRSVTIPRRKDHNAAGMKLSTPITDGLGLSMGIGFVEYGTRDEAMRAIRLMQGKIVDGHALELTLSRPAAKQPEGSAEAGRALARRAASAKVAAEAPKSAKLIVRNMPFEATKSEIRDLFTSFAQVKAVRLPKRSDGRQRGFAFVEFLTKQEAAAALEAAKDIHFYGRHLVVEYAASAVNNNGPDADNNNNNNNGNGNGNN